MVQSCTLFQERLSVNHMTGDASDKVGETLVQHRTGSISKTPSAIITNHVYASSGGMAIGATDNLPIDSYCLLITQYLMVNCGTYQ